MQEGTQKYELLVLLPLSGTEEELKAFAGKIEEQLKVAGATISGSAPIQKGRLAYALENVRQGYYHCLQFEMMPATLAEFQRNLLLSGATLRFSIKKINGAFKAFVPSAPAAQRTTSPRVAFRSQVHSMPTTFATASAPPSATATLTQEIIKPEAVKKVSMEEIDKRLEEILGES